MYSLILALSPLLQCAKQAGKSVMGFISSTILTLVEGGREAFNSMGKVRPLYRLDKIKQKTSTVIVQGLQDVLEKGRAVVLSMVADGDDTDDEEQVEAHIIL